MQRYVPGAAGRRGSLRWSTRLIGIAGTLLLHVLMFEAGTLGVAAAKRRAPDETGPGASALVTGASPALTLVLVHSPEVSQTPDLERLASVGVANPHVAIQIVSPNPALAIDESLLDADAEEAMAAGDPTARSVLFGRYTGQLQARIERAWLKPRTPVGQANAPVCEGGRDSPDGCSEMFRCVARILQDERGHITEIELTRCNGSPLWQQSLVHAIQASSPLPAPPDPSVFSSVVMMSFEAPAYRAGMSDRGYAGAGEWSGVSRAAPMPM